LVPPAIQVLKKFFFYFVDGITGKEVTSPALKWRKLQKNSYFTTAQLPTLAIVKSTPRIQRREEMNFTQWGKVMQFKKGICNKKKCENSSPCTGG
jgi:hypothetical protein